MNGGQLAIRQLFLLNQVCQRIDLFPPVSHRLSPDLIRETDIVFDCPGREMEGRFNHSVLFPKRLCVCV